MPYVGPSDQVVTLSQYSALPHLPTLPFPVMLERLIRGLQGGEPHPPLFFMAHHLWLHGFGAEEIALRSLPLLWSLGAIAGPGLWIGTIALWPSLWTDVLYFACGQSFLPVPFLKYADVYAPCFLGDSVCLGVDGD